ncbi:class I SAM-dependent methyltransferase [bacterium]|nr:class I SAM-dependent methyltransferase [bacterium]
MTTTVATGPRERQLAAAIRDHWSGFLAANDELKLLQRDHDFSSVALTDVAERCRDRVLEEAQAINGANWNYWSNALQPPVVETFDVVLRQLAAAGHVVDYLEIGSCQGMSMGVIGLLLREYGLLRTLTSVDPYWSDGYDEVGHLEIDQETKGRAFRLYERLGLPVRLVEATSFEGLPELIRERQRYGLVYVDGRHERMNPAVDLGLSWALLADDGIVMLDDHRWADVAPLKALCDSHLEPVHECWKVAAWRKSRWK